jgi:glucose-6-phosphate 1-dehydrogenase
MLLLEAIHGKQTWFLSFEEVRTSWRLVDPLLHHLEKESTPLYAYSAGSMGPEEADSWIAKDGAKWMQ